MTIEDLRISDILEYRNNRMFLVIDVEAESYSRLPVWVFGHRNEDSDAQLVHVGRLKWTPLKDLVALERVFRRGKIIFQTPTRQFDRNGVEMMP
ncbi:hypothetical protein HN588_12325 [Candidatus Bathyarchaeota archaeon]|nr:hypothetical protein [Candidatus Bathyarchaeota archaeon]